MYCTDVLHFLIRPGLYNFLEKRKSAGTLSEVAGSNGLVNCVFICCDLPYQYIDEYFDKVGAEAFHPIRNQVRIPSQHLCRLLISVQNLAAVDLYRYDEAWELRPAEAIAAFGDEDETKPDTVLIDLRKPDDFIMSNIPGSYNLPLQSLTATTPSPFFDADVLERQWKELDAMLSVNTISAYDLSDKNVGVICYGGDTARVATSVLRARGITASSIKGGFRALAEELPQLQTKTRQSFHQWSKSPGTASPEAQEEPVLADASPSVQVLVNVV